MINKKIVVMRKKSESSYSKVMFNKNFIMELAKLKGRNMELLFLVINDLIEFNSNKFEITRGFKDSAMQNLKMDSNGISINLVKLSECNVIKRIKNFNISFDEAKKEIKEMYPKYADILDELVAPGKTNIEISNILWEEIINLMYIASGNSYKSSEESIQRQLGLVIYLFNKEFNLWN